MSKIASAWQIDLANCVLRSFARNSWIERRRSGWFVCWGNKSIPEGIISRRWSTRGNDFYPVWYRRWANGGTACTALSQLIRWLRGQPVLPISTWRYWASEKCQLLPNKSVDILVGAGYPENANCVLCGERIEGYLDWWSLNGVSGPCCGWTSGCRQNPATN